MTAFSKDEARRLTVNIAKLSKFVQAQGLILTVLDRPSRGFGDRAGDGREKRGLALC